MTTVLASPASSLQLWKRFQAGRCSDVEIADSLVLRRWMRCRRSGLSADNPGEPTMALAGLAESIEAFAPLLAPGAPFDAFATRLAHDGFCGVLCDSTGRVVASRVSEAFEPTVASQRLVEGAVWSEGARGTNGVGTTLEEATPVAIIGAEHYEQRNHVFACYGAPIRDVRERVVGVLDATGPVSCEGPFIHAAVVAAAAALEALIIGRTYDAAIAGGLFALERRLERLPHAALLMESTGRVRRANSPFRSLIPATQDADLRRFLGPKRMRAGTAPRLLEAGAPRALRGLAVEIEPLGQPDDPFASIVHLIPRNRPRRTAWPASSVPSSFSGIVGSDPAIVAAREQAARFAGTDLPVLLLGETGTGKELFARAVHAASPRAKQPFVAVNSGTLTGTLLESELFGYGPAAFTGAAASGRNGKLAAGHGGTLFLDEVGELSLPVQAMLLRFLEDGTFYRVGETVERFSDVRLIAATSRDLPALVQDGRFRTDLYFRMRGVVLRLPPLRDRTDVRELAEALLQRIAQGRKLDSAPGLSPEANAWIERYEWPGNVRELRTSLDYAVVLAGEDPQVELWHLPIDQLTETRERGELLSSVERGAVLRALDRSRGNMSDAARHLGVARSTLYRMLDRHGLRGN
jgi:transcriptional regulator of acetoin/glycerol metabolism